MPWNAHPHENSVHYGPKINPKINCPKHGVHGHIIHSTIAGYEGDWCQICWLETLGAPLPLVTEEDD